MTHRLTVLVTACGCPGGPSLVRALSEGFRVVATDADPTAAGRFHADAFHLTPPGGNPAFVEALLGICQREGVRAVLPESSAEVLALARARDLFEAQGIAVLVSRPEAVAQALDKAKTYQAMEGFCVPLPEYRIVQEDQNPRAAYEALECAIQDMGWPGRPVVLKRPGGKGGRGVWIVEGRTVDRMDLDMRTWPNAQRLNGHEVATWVERRMRRGRRLGRWLVMEHLQGEESSADLYGTVFGFTKLRRSCRQGLHHHHEARYDQGLMDLGRRVVERLGLEYFVNVQFLAGKLLEVNPRISTMIYYRDFNMPLLGLKLALGLADRVTVRLPDGIRAQYYHDLRSYGEPTEGGNDG